MDGDREPSMEDRYLAAASLPACTSSALDASKPASRPPYLSISQVWVWVWDGGVWDEAMRGAGAVPTDVPPPPLKKHNHTTRHLYED